MRIKVAGFFGWLLAVCTFCVGRSGELPGFEVSVFAGGDQQGGLAVGGLVKGHGGNLGVVGGRDGRVQHKTARDRGVVGYCYTVFITLQRNLNWPCSPQTNSCNSCNICTSASVHRKPTASGSAPAQQLSDAFPPPLPTTSRRHQTPLWPPRTAAGPIHECTPAARCPAVGETDNVNLVSTLSSLLRFVTCWKLTLYSSLSLWSE